MHPRAVQKTSMWNGCNSCLGFKPGDRSGASSRFGQEISLRETSSDISDLFFFSCKPPISLVPPFPGPVAQPYFSRNFSYPRHHISAFVLYSLTSSLNCPRASFPAAPCPQVTPAPRRKGCLCTFLSPCQVLCPNFLQRRFQKVSPCFYLLTVLQKAQEQTQMRSTPLLRAGRVDFFLLAFRLWWIGQALWFPRAAIQFAVEECFSERGRRAFSGWGTVLVGWIQDPFSTVSLEVPGAALNCKSNHFCLGEWDGSILFFPIH